MIFSVVTPAKDPPQDQLMRCIRCVQNQSVQAFSHIIVDDGSSTPISNYLAREEFANLKVLRNERSIGPGKSRNQAIAKSVTDFIAFLDVDDWWDQNRLELAAQTIIKDHPVPAVLYYSSAVAVRESGVTRQLKAEFEGSVTSNLCHNIVVTGSCSSAIVARKALDMVGGFSVYKTDLPEDRDLWIRLSQIGDFKIVRGTNAYIYQGANNRSNMSEARRVRSLNFARKYSKLAQEIGEYQTLWKTCHYIQARCFAKEGEYRSAIANIGKVFLSGDILLGLKCLILAIMKR